MNGIANKDFGKIIVVLLFVSFSFYIYNLTGWLIQDDEGGYLYQSWRISQGELPYRDFYSPKMPLFLLTGGFVFKLFAPSVLSLRLLTVLSTHLIAFFTFLIAKEVYQNQKIALSSSIGYLALNVVFLQARFFRPTAYMTFFSTVGLFLFIKAFNSKSKSFFLLSGIFFGIACAGFKLVGIIPAASCLAYFLYQIFFDKEEIDYVCSCLLFYVVGLLASIGLIFACSYMVSPNFFSCILGHHFDLKEKVYSVGEIFPMLRCLAQSKSQKHYLLAFLIIPVLIKYLFVKNDPKKVFSFIVFFIPIIFIAPYFWQILRYMLYAVPVITVVFSAMVIDLLSHKNKLFKATGILIIGFSLFIIFIPSLKRNYGFARLKENDTLALAQYIQENTREDDFIVSCYGSLPFHARRKVPYLMGGISQSAVESGRITAPKLIKEIQDNNVKMVLLHLEGGIDGRLIPLFGTDFGPNHLNTLIKSEQGPIFMNFVKRNFTLLRKFNRAGQIFYIYKRME